MAKRKTKAELRFERIEMDVRELLRRASVYEGRIEKMLSQLYAIEHTYRQNADAVARSFNIMAQVDSRLETNKMAAADITAEVMDAVQPQIDILADRISQVNEYAHKIARRKRR